MNKSHLTDISRTKEIDGKTVPAFINNLHYHFIDLPVFADGVIDCWEVTDLEIFKQKLEEGWVETSIPNGRIISIHGLGSWEITSGNWNYNKGEFFKYILSVIRELNPQMVNLYQHHEREINGVKIGESTQGAIFQEIEPDIFFPKRIKGESINLFFKNAENKCYLVDVNIFAGEQIILKRLPQEIKTDFKNLKDLAKNGSITSEINSQIEVEIYGLGKFTALERRSVPITEKMLEIEDIITQLNKKPTSLQLCRELYQLYLKSPSIDLKEKLKIAYEKIPEHQCSYVGDMDVKDIAVRMIIYGEDEIKEWSHYKAAQEFGEELPTIILPKPPEK